jgi:hypothetical protein
VFNIHEFFDIENFSTFFHELHAFWNVVLRYAPHNLDTLFVCNKLQPIEKFLEDVGVFVMGHHGTRGRMG